MIRTLFPLAALLAGCVVEPPVDDVKVTDDTADLTGPEDDGDGFTPEEGDCDDDNAEVNPAATEICNGIDDNCDGVVDEDVFGTFYADVDADGFGDPAAASESCEPGRGQVANANDCDDSEPNAFPGNVEQCDAVDNDCDGVVDDGVTATWYPDADLDGHGDPDAGFLACELPVGAVSTGDDCDDSTAAAFPGNVEACDEIDNDCDGVVDEGVTTTWYGDLDGDGHGDGALVEEACDRPVGYAPAEDDCDDADADVFPGADELCDGADDDCDGAIDEADAIDALLWYTDADADGYGDPGSATLACDAPPGTVDDASDCDDGRAASFPGASEYCNGHDDDCDGTLDEDSAVDAPTWYLDYDGDGWGGERITTVACDAPANHVADATDCDDADPTTSPGEPEACDGYDEDCSGYADDGGVCPCDVAWYDGHPYMFCTSNVTWTSALATCEAYDYDLVTVNDAAEDAWLVSVGATYTSATAAYWWTGFNDRASEGSWGWEDGSPVTWTQWNSLEPNNSDDEDCGQLVWYTHWNDWDCANLSTYICEAD